VGGRRIAGSPKATINAVIIIVPRNLSERQEEKRPRGAEVERRQDVRVAETGNYCCQPMDHQCACSIGHHIKRLI
jgi:hypothetical protein